MDAAQVDKLMQYALAVAGESDDWKDKDLGPIHLVKYVYLADLAYAERKGTTLTGAPWRFYHFGPYCNEVWKRVEPAMAAMMAEDKSFESAHRDEDVLRWRSSDPERDRADAGAGLHITAKLAIERSVREWGSDTQGLLHHVYNTRPMLRAAPNDLLVFEPLEPTEKFEPLPPPTKKEKKQARARIEALREKLAERQAAREPRRTKPMRSPRYDDVYTDGVAWLDELAGESPPEHEGVMSIDDSVWRSETRGGRGDP